MKFPRDTQFDSAFDEIPDLTWYPYVGPNYLKSNRRVLVFAHNIPVNADEYEGKLQDWKSKEYWAKCVEEYAYTNKVNYTKAFRYFIKAAVGLKGDYDYNSDADTQSRVDAFIQGIGYLNYIQELVKKPDGSDKQSVVASPSQIKKSKLINKRILNILKPTHCICWGRHVFSYIKQNEEFKASAQDKSLGKGFATSCITTDEGHPIKLLKIYHPSMPGLRPYSDHTHNIIRTFMEE